MFRRALSCTLALASFAPLALAQSKDQSAPPPSAPAPKPDTAASDRQRIERLIDLVSGIDAVFIRGNSETSARTAADQMRAKFGAAGEHPPVVSAFIEQFVAGDAKDVPALTVRPRGGKDVDGATYLNILLSAIDRFPAPAAKPAPKMAARPALGVPFSIELDCSEAPELKEWGEKARAICEEQYPVLCELLNSEGFKPRPDLRIVFKGSMRAPAATGGGTISVNAPYVTQHPDDFGMMVHELTHAVQQYRRAPRGADMGWLTEGIADYTRFYKYEPGADKSRIDPEKASYRDSYRTTAAFLNYLVDKHDKDIVVKLNARMRAGTCTEATFKELLNTEVADLWKEFAATLPKHG